MKSHWEQIYLNKADNEVSWYQTTPITSLRLIETYGSSRSKKIIDVGAGNSNLLIDLYRDGYESLTALDISLQALQRTQTKLGDAAKNINWYESDVLQFKVSKQYDVWHDRAVFHFLTDEQERLLYKQVMLDHLSADGIVVLATFSKDGPMKCSGLEICQYDEVGLKEIMGDQFELLESFNEVHRTPFNTDQAFLYTVWQRKEAFNAKQ